MSTPSFTSFASGTTSYGESCHTIFNGFLYTSGTNSSFITRVNLTTKTVDSSWAKLDNNNLGSRVMTNDGTYIYIVYIDKVHRISIANPTNITLNWTTYATPGPYIGCGTHYNGNIYLGATGSSTSKIYSINTTTGSSSTLITATQSITALEYFDGFIYYYVWGTGLYRKSITTTATASLVFDTATLTGTYSSTNAGMVIGNNYVLLASFAGNFGLFSLLTTTHNTAAITEDSRAKYNISNINGNIYYVQNDTTNVYIARTPALLIPPPPPPPPPSNSVSINAANTTVVASGNLRVSIVDPSNTLANGIYYEYSVNGSGYVNTGVFAGTSPNTLYVLSSDISNTVLIRAKNVSGNSTPISVPSNLSIIYQRPRAPPTPTFTIVGSGNVQVSINESTTTPAPYYYLNNVSYHLYAYNTFGGTNLSGNTSTLVYNQPVGVLSNTNSTYSQVVSYVNTGLNANTYTMYVVARNTIGNSTPVFANIAVLTTPVSPSIDTGNTFTVASGNLQVRITDPSNTSLNVVYYQYALNSSADASFANTFVRANVSPYTFFIPSITDISNTLYVRATNPVGNSSPAANRQVVVYQTPRTPSQVSFTLVGSGNVQVTIAETAPIPFYYLNNVSYYLYPYNTFGGTNLSGNTSLAVYNRSVGILSNTNSTYNSVVTYVNTGLNANTYTMYVVARNSIGNSTPFSANIVVYTTPIVPTIDTGNTKSTTSGNLTVAFTDPSNNNHNAISYVYYVLDPSGTNNSGNLAYYSNTNLSLTTGAQQSFSVNGAGYINKTYTVYLRSVNVLGVSTAISTNVTVYTVPTDIYVDTANVKTVASGNLRVSLVDPSNGTNNGVYYQYSVIGVNGNAYTNANAQGIGSSNIYQFYINVANPDNYTINVIAKNTVGTSNANTFTTKVYTLPNAPLIDQPNTLSKTSGNLSVSFNDTTNVVINEVGYSYYLHDYDPSIQLYYV
jgi:hypothetical protein